MSKRGHSNLHVEQIQSYSRDLPDVAKIPLEGGANVYTVKELPPLSLRREEWCEIGERMKWQYKFGGMMRLKIVDQEGIVEVEDLTDTGRQQIRYECQQLIEEIDEAEYKAQNEEQKDDNQ